MAKAMLPFYALYVGDGTATVFTLDISKDPFYYANDFVFASPTQTIPARAALSPEFDHKLTPTNILSVQAQNAANGTDFGPVTISIDQYQITFTLTTAPPN